MAQINVSSFSPLRNAIYFQYNLAFHVCAKIGGLIISLLASWAGTYLIFLDYLCRASFYLRVSLKGSCIGQGAYSELSMQGLDVQSLVSVPESDTDSVIETDDIEIVERKQHSSSIQATAVKPGV